MRQPEQQLQQPLIRPGHECGQCHIRRRYQLWAWRGGSPIVRVYAAFSKKREVAGSFPEWRAGRRRKPGASRPRRGARIAVLPAETIPVVSLRAARLPAPTRT
jgi:hypothetical protein